MTTETRPTSEQPGNDHWVERLQLPNGLSCYLPAADMKPTAAFCVREIFTWRRYCREGFGLNPGDHVFDIGGNVGVFVLWAAPQIGNGRIISVEPAPTFTALEMNIGLNHLTNVRAVRAAIGKDGGELEMLYHPRRHSMARSIGMHHTKLVQMLTVNKKINRETEVIRVPSLSIERILDEQKMTHVDYLKIDCEGGEYEALRDLTATGWKQIRRIAIEFHEFTQDQQPGELVSLLEAQGFVVEVEQPFWQRLIKVGAIWARRTR